MTEFIISCMSGAALGFGFLAMIFSFQNSKRINKLEKRVNKLDKQVDDLITACNLNTKHIDELVVASTDTMNIVSEHIDAIKELKKRR